MNFRKSKINEDPKKQMNNRSASYIKPTVEGKATTSIKQSLVNKYTNFSFSFTGGLQRFKSAIVGESKMQYPGYIYLLGKKFPNMDQAVQEYRTFIWFSYRKIPGMTKQMNSDTSWGCLIRVGQMAFAASLKKHLALKTKFNDKTICTNIITAFLDQKDPSNKYSLTKIVQQARVLFDINYGKWFSASQICSCLVSLHHKNPLRGTQDLKTLFYPYSQMFIFDICKQLEVQVCKCKKRRIACPYCCLISEKVQQPTAIQTMTFNKEIDISKSLALSSKMGKQHNQPFQSTFRQERKKTFNHVLVFATCQLSMGSTVPQSKYKQLKQILSLECSMGLIGGIPRKGFYFVGFDENDNKLIYLDPHYVQEEVKLNNLLEMMGTFFCHDMRKCSREQMDCSLAFAFFIDDLRSLQKLHDKIEEMKEKYQDYILSLDWENQFPQKNRSSQFEDVEADYELGECENSFIIDLDD